MALAFKEYSQTIKDKPHRFEVDLSTEGMLEHREFDDDKKTLKETECDAWCVIFFHLSVFMFFRILFKCECSFLHFLCA